jgi:mannose-6-phosphate isomerase-like protein (cupin superfamily)
MEPCVQAFDFAQQEARRAASGAASVEFLRTSTFEVRVYSLAKGAADPQTPHTEDEVYVVMEGRASFQAEGREVPLKPGSVLFVAKGVEHRFARIEEDLRVLVLFAPPRAPQPR